MRWKALAKPLLIVSVEGMPKIGEIFISEIDIDLPETILIIWWYFRMGLLEGVPMCEWSLVVG